MTDPLFVSLDSKKIAKEVSRAKLYACYVAPGILDGPAEAFAELSTRLGPDRIVICLDFNEQVMRMGYGTLSAVATLRKAEICITTTSGLRIGLLIVDGDGFVFTPTALYLEADDRSSKAPNALRLSSSETEEALARLSAAAKRIALGSTSCKENVEEIEERPVEVESKEVDPDEFEKVEQRLEEAPPVRFDLARQVHVYNSYLQYVEIKLAGVAIQRRRLALPAHILGLTDNDELAHRLKTTFDLIEKNNKLSSKNLEDMLNTIRINFTRVLKKGYGRVVLKSAKPHLEKRLQDFREQLDRHREQVRKDLQESLNDSRCQIIKYLLPNILESPPDRLIGMYGRSDEWSARRWISHELDRLFPNAASLAEDMRLDVRYKDLTFETLETEDFLKAVKAAFPGTDWETAHEEYRAVGEQRP